MPMRFPIPSSDINVWGMVLNDALRVLLDSGHVYVVANGNNPPTVKAGTRFTYYRTGSYTPPASPATGNTAYPVSTAKTINESDVIAEPADRTFSWSGSGGTGSTFPAISPSSTYYLHCSGADDVATAGLGIYNVSTNAPTWDAVKGGWYNAGGRVICQFKTDGASAVYDVIPYALHNNQIQMLATSTLLGRNTAGAGDVEQLSIATVLTMLGGLVAPDLMCVSLGPTNSITLTTKNYRYIAKFKTKRIYGTSIGSGGSEIFTSSNGGMRLYPSTYTDDANYQGNFKCITAGTYEFTFYGVFNTVVAGDYLYAILSTSASNMTSGGGTCGTDQVLANNVSGHANGAIISLSYIITLTANTYITINVMDGTTNGAVLYGNADGYCWCTVKRLK